MSLDGFSFLGSLVTIAIPACSKWALALVAVFTFSVCCGFYPVLVAISFFPWDVCLLLSGLHPALQAVALSLFPYLLCLLTLHVNHLTHLPIPSAFVFLCSICFPLSAPEPFPASPPTFPLHQSHGIYSLGSMFFSHHYPIARAILFLWNTLPTLFIWWLLLVLKNYHQGLFSIEIRLILGRCSSPMPPP